MKMCPGWIVLLPLLAGGCVSYSGIPDQLAAPAAQHEYRVVRDRVYTPADWPEPLTADLYLPRTCDRIQARRFPAVLVVHGGGWQEGRTRSDMESIAGRLAGHGFVALNVSYRYAPGYTFPAQLYDLQQAMHWLHDHAAEYCIDTDRIGGFGYSAGAHLVALLATVSEGDALDRPHGGPETRLHAVVAGGTPSDLRKFRGGTLVPQFLGATRAENPAVYAMASPVEHVTGDDPPTFLYHGGLDRTVSAEHAEDLHAALKAAGVEAELYIEHSRGHITMFLFDGAAVSAAIAFLKRRLSAADPEAGQ